MINLLSNLYNTPVIICNKCKSISDDNYIIAQISADINGDTVYKDESYIIIDKVIDLSHAGFYIIGSIEDGMYIQTEHTEPQPISMLHIKIPEWDCVMHVYLREKSINMLKL